MVAGGGRHTSSLSALHNIQTFPSHPATPQHLCTPPPPTLQAVHQFDQFTEQTSGSFHPRGLEVILNSEVWDMRTLRLLR